MVISVQKLAQVIKSNAYNRLPKNSETQQMKLRNIFTVKFQDLKYKSSSTESNIWKLMRKINNLKLNNC